MKGAKSLNSRFRKYLWPNKVKIVSLWILMAFFPPLGATAPHQSADERGTGKEAQIAGQELIDIHDVLFRANQAYLNDQYEKAVEQYDAIIRQGHLNGHIFYNLGNSYIRLNQLGQAILNYKRASFFLPRDGDLKANLKYARSLIQDRIEDSPPSLWRTLAFWYFSMNFQELLFTFFLLYAFFFISALSNLYRNSEWIKWSVALSFLISLLLGVSSGIKYHETLYNTEGVILTEEAPIRA